MQLAGCVITDKAGRVLLIHRRTPDLTRWMIPGGKIEPEERPDITAVRELKEELGVDARLDGKIGIAHFEFRGTPCEYHYFRATLGPGQEPTVQEAAHDRCAYIDINADGYAFSHGVKGLRELQEANG